MRAHYACLNCEPKARLRDGSGYYCITIIQIFRHHDHSRKCRRVYIIPTDKPEAHLVSHRR